jgi:hypothetical protein
VAHRNVLGLRIVGQQQQATAYLPLDPRNLPSCRKHPALKFNETARISRAESICTSLVHVSADPTQNVYKKRQNAPHVPVHHYWYFVSPQPFTMISETMKAIRIVSVGKAEIQTVPVPRLRGYFILVKVSHVAINPTDWYEPLT